MCGFVCIFNSNGNRPAVPEASLLRMHRRGPDGGGMWGDEYAFLGHRRLSIIDLDTRAAQPMHSTCRRYVIVFNGEIYNFLDLRNELLSLGVVFHTNCDTEVLLNLFIREGQVMLRRLRGMFAFVIWDKIERKAFAARDPYGIKPLYLAKIKDGVAFASQVKALLATNLVEDHPNPTGWAGFWMLGSVPEPHTLYKNIIAVRAGHSIWIEKGKIGAQCFWEDIGKVWRNASQVKAGSISEYEVKFQVRKSIRESVDRHLVADVPIGVFLSGGIDSSVIGALVRESGPKSLIGITIAFTEYRGKKQDETTTAAKVAKHYGINHIVRTVERREFCADLPRILDAMDQPSIDGINTWYASKAASEQGLKVVLSGIGGDELFLGYDSFRRLPALMLASRALSAFQYLHNPANKIFCAQAYLSGNRRWRQVIKWLSQGVAGAWWLQRSSMSPDEAEATMAGHFASPLFDFAPKEWVCDMVGPLAENALLAFAQIESTTYLRNQLLRDSDWASMDHGVELRTPLVDVKLLKEFETLLHLFHNYKGKALLSNVPIKPLPVDVLIRRKTGFNIPVFNWSDFVQDRSHNKLARHSWMDVVSKQFNWDKISQS